MSAPGHSHLRWRPTSVSAAGIMVAVLVVPVGVFALASGAGLVKLPYGLFLVARRLPVVFPIHMISSGLAMLLIPLVITLRRHCGWHKALGRLAAGLVCVGGLTALPVALSSEASLAVRAGFFVQGIVWVTLMGAGIWAIRHRQIERHTHLMLAVAAVTSGAIWLRIATVAAVQLELPFDTVYALAAWASWLVPLGVVTGCTMHDARCRSRSHALACQRGLSHHDASAAQLKFAPQARGRVRCRFQAERNQ